MHRYCIAVTDRRGPVVRFVSGIRAGRFVTTANQPTVGRDGSPHVGDRIKYFATVSDALFWIRRLKRDPRKVLTIWSDTRQVVLPGGPGTDPPIRP